MVGLHLKQSGFGCLWCDCPHFGGKVPLGVDLRHEVNRCDCPHFGGKAGQGFLTFKRRQGWLANG